MPKTRLFSLISFAAGAAVSLAAPALAGPWHPCDDRVYFSRVGFGYVRPVVVAPVIAQPVVAQSVAPVATSVITVPAGSDVSIRQGWSGSDIRISTPTNTTVVSSSPAWASAGEPVVVASPATPVVVSPTIITVPNTPIYVPNNVVEPLGAHDRLVVLNEFSAPAYDGRTLLYRDASGLLHERSVYGSSGIFYDHLGRRCRYDNDRSMVVILDDRVVRDYNRNGVCDDDRFVDLHRRAELNFYRDSTYRPIGSVYQPGDWRDRYRRVGDSGFRTVDPARLSNNPPPVFRDDRPADVQRLTSPGRTGPAVNGRLIDDSRLTGNDRKPQNTGARPKR